MRGRPPKPQPLRVLEGRATRAEAAAEAAKPAAPPLPGPPRRLSAAERRAWREVAEAAPWADARDAVLVERAAVTLARLREAEAQVARDGLVIEGRQGGPVRHPALATARAADDALARWLSGLGAGPVGRARLGERTGEDADDPMAQLLARVPRRGA